MFIESGEFRFRVTERSKAGGWSRHYFSSRNLTVGTTVFGLGTAAWERVIKLK